MDQWEIFDEIVAVVRVAAVERAAEPHAIAVATTNAFLEIISTLISMGGDAPDLSRSADRERVTVSCIGAIILAMQDQAMASGDMRQRIGPDELHSRTEAILKGLGPV